MKTREFNSKEEGQSKDPDFANAEAALIRAGLKAREHAKLTGTSVVIMENGKIVKLPPEETL